MRFFRFLDIAVVTALCVLVPDRSASAARNTPLDLLSFTKARASPAKLPTPAVRLPPVAYEWYSPGTIVIETGKHRLSYVLENGESIRYPIAVGREGFKWKGTAVISDKKENPDWYPPPQMLRRQPWLPRHMAGGPKNPLGERALYLKGTLYRIHGTIEPWTIGTAGRNQGTGEHLRRTL